MRGRLDGRDKNCTERRAQPDHGRKRDGAPIVDDGRAEAGVEAAGESQEEVCDRIEAVSARIRVLPATTFQGLAVKALSLTFATSLFDEEPDDMDWDQFCLRGFATEVLRHLPDDTQCQRLTEALADNTLACAS